MKPCSVELCPAYAEPNSATCSAHRVAKRLAYVIGTKVCMRCRRELHPGDYVTIDSTLDWMIHAMCPAKKQRPAPRGPAATPLLDAAEREPE